MMSRLDRTGTLPYTRKLLSVLESRCLQIRGVYEFVASKSSWFFLVRGFYEFVFCFFRVVMKSREGVRGSGEWNKLIVCACL